MNSTENFGRKIRSANLHVEGRCNYTCEHCFARCLKKYETRRPEDWIPHLEYLREIGVEKINIVGGEPMLYKYLDELCFLIKDMGFIVTIVSNGSLITEDWIRKMKGTVSWIGLSIDSCSEVDEILIGRHCRGVNHLENVVRVSDIAHRYGMKVKLNITVVRKSWNKDFRPYIERVNAERVKALRALTLENANDDVADTWSITDEQFQSFVDLHKGCKNIVFEDNDDMVGSYLMFGPNGDWMMDNDKKKTFSEFDELVKNGPESRIDVAKYYRRKAVYGW